MNLENHRYVEQTVPKQMRRLSYPTFACVQELKVKSGIMGAGSALIALIYKVEPISRNGPIFRGAFTVYVKTE